MIKRILKAIWNYLLVIGEARAEMIKHKGSYSRGY